MIPRTRKRRTLIPTPQEWHWNMPVPPPPIPVLAQRGGTQLISPKPVFLVDTREKNPFNLARFGNWCCGVKYQALPLGDYSVAGLEDDCVVERKDLPDLIHSFTTNRAIFTKRLRRMASYPQKLLIVTASWTQIKSPYDHGGAKPNQVTQSLIATLTGAGVPFICSDNHELGEEIVASFLYQVHLYHWLETNNEGRYLADGEL
jgi:ERCC4-type nuclease